MSALASFAQSFEVNETDPDLVDSNTDTDADTKPTENEDDSKYQSLIVTGKSMSAFLKQFGFLAALIIVYFVSGASLLFLTKVSQSNIAPTSAGCSPYVVPANDAQVIAHDIDIFETNVKGVPMARKMNFGTEAVHLTPTGITEMLSSLKHGAHANRISAYFAAIGLALISFNYAFLNESFNAVGGYLSESAIVLAGPLLIPLILGSAVFSSLGYSIYQWFAQMKWLFRYNANAEDVPPITPPAWTEISMLDPTRYGTAIALGCAFITLFWFAFGSGALIIASVVSVGGCLVSMMSYMSQLTGDKEFAHISHIVVDTLRYYKHLIALSVSAALIYASGSNLGYIPTVISAAMATALYLDVYPTDLFVSVVPSHLLPKQVYKIARRTCADVRPTTINTESLLSLL